jgi:hypothetical protein
MADAGAVARRESRVGVHESHGDDASAVWTSRRSRAKGFRRRRRAAAKALRTRAAPSRPMQRSSAPRLPVRAPFICPALKTIEPSWIFCIRCGPCRSGGNLRQPVRLQTDLGSTPLVVLGLPGFRRDLLVEALEHHKASFVSQGEIMQCKKDVIF